jgi:hypothetical protein
VLPPDRNRHSAHANRDRVAAERPQVQRLNSDALIEAEMLEAAGLSLIQPLPIDRRNARLGADRQAIEGDDLRMERRIPCCE